MNQRQIRSSLPSLHFTFKMSQAFAILQMSQLELAELVQEEIEKNPLLEEISSPKEKETFPETASTLSFYEHMLAQIRENFSSLQEQKSAQLFLEYLDEKGFLSMSLREIGEKESISEEYLERILQVLQTFHPPGLFARSLQESLLLQLKHQGLENTDISHLVEHYFADFLHGRYRKIQQKMKTIDIGEAIHRLALLQLRPLNFFKSEILSPIIPDIIIENSGDKWTIRVEDDALPQFQIHAQYSTLTPQSREEQKTLSFWRSQGKWLLHSLKKRKKLLLQVSKYITSRQANYLASQGNLECLTVEEIAEHLSLHSSTISRALAGKYADTPRGIILLRSLINTSPEKVELKDLLENLIEEEDKSKPLTDQQIVEYLLAKNHKIARRTVAKYRTELKIPSAKTRKNC